MAEGLKSVSVDVIKIQPKRKNKFNKRLGIIANGDDNDYPTQVELLIGASVTATQCAGVYAKFLRGNGFDKSIGNTIVGKDKNVNVTVNKLLKKACVDLSKQSGVFLHVNYNMLGEISSINHIPYKHCRFGESDSDNYSGKIVIYDNWDYCKGSKIMTDEFIICDAFNPIKEVVLHQIEAAGGIDKYKGQIFHLFLNDEYDYAVSPVDVSEKDAFSEYLLSVYKFNILENDFITDRHIFRHNPMDKKDLEKLKENLRTMKGAKGQGRILLIQDNFDEQLPNGLIKIDSIKSGVNDKLFESWEKSLSNNIRRGFNNIPQILIDEVQGKLGNSSGEAYKEAQRVFNRMTQEDRDLISEAFEMLLSYFDKSIIPAVGELEIIPFNILDEEELK
jgi:hypothetical protein